MDDPTEALKRGLEKGRLPADLKEQILAQLPPPEEHERLYRELLARAAAKGHSRKWSAGAVPERAGEGLAWR